MRLLCLLFTLAMFALAGASYASAQTPLPVIVSAAWTDAHSFKVAQQNTLPPSTVAVVTTGTLTTNGNNPDGSAAAPVTGTYTSTRPAQNSLLHNVVTVTTLNPAPAAPSSLPSNTTYTVSGTVGTLTTTSPTLDGGVTASFVITFP